MKTEELKKITGLPIQEKVARVVDSDYTVHELYQLTGVNESTLTRLKEERNKPVNERSVSLKLISALKIANRFDEMVQEGKFPDVDRNTYKGVSLKSKISYIFNLDMKTTELSELTGAKYISLAKLRSKEYNIDNAIIRNLIPLESTFEKLVASGMLKLEQDSEHLVTSNKKTTSNNLADDVYASIRQYRYGHYLVIDEDDTETQQSLYNTIRSNISLGNKIFNFDYFDNIIDTNFNLSFNFIVKVTQSVKDEFSFKIINKQVKEPKY